jgi:dTDP-4-dehydrorhamnose 3,5-epimerase
MKFNPTGIDGSWVVNLPRFEDDRGWFQEWFKFSRFASETGIDFLPVQANISQSLAGTIRGVHYSLADEGQGKLITVMYGAIDDYVIDLRRDSPTFGRWCRVRLTDSNATSVLLHPHVGHAFQAISEVAVVSYLVTREFDPVNERAINPFCPDLAVDWSVELRPLVSEKDSLAPGTREAIQKNLLPSMR